MVELFKFVVGIAAVVTIRTIEASGDVSADRRDIGENVGGSSTIFIMVIIVTNLDFVVALLDARLNFK